MGDTAYENNLSPYIQESGYVRILLKVDHVESTGRTTRIVVLNADVCIA
jgi:hypothetical protein